MLSPTFPTVSNYEQARRERKASGAFPTSFMVVCIIVFLCIGLYGFHLDSSFHESQRLKTSLGVSEHDDNVEVMLKGEASNGSASSFDVGKVPAPHRSSSLNNTWQRRTQKYPVLNRDRLKESDDPRAMRKYIIQDEKAICMDGSPSVYYFANGSDSGMDKFQIHFQGGGWCFNISECYEAAVNGAPWPPSSSYNTPEHMSYARSSAG